MITQFYIIEIIQYQSGEYGHLVHYVFDADPVQAQLKAESKYYEIMSAAAVSTTLKHSAIIISDESLPVLYHCYKHNLGPTPE